MAPIAYPLEDKLSFIRHILDRHPDSNTNQQNRRMPPSPPFKPLTITLENLEETKHLMQAIRLYEEYHAHTSAEARFAKGFLEWLQTHLQLTPDKL
jgi:hypothetical protein